MKIVATAANPLSLSADLAVFPCFQGAKKMTEAAAAADKALGGRLAAERFDGADGESVIVNGAAGTAKIALLGVGEKPLSAAGLRKAAARAARLARSAKAKRLALVLTDVLGDAAACGRAAAEGLLLGDYRFLKYKDEERKKYEQGMIEEAILVVRSKNAALERGIAAGELMSRATVFSRGLVNEPALEMTPAKLVSVAENIAAAHPHRISLEVFDKRALERLGAGGLLAVSRGSDEPPYMIHLVYKPKKKAKKKIVLVGKGITFDSGGLSLKPSDGMEDMKIDMAGCAAVLGVFSVLAELAPDVEVHGVSGICENMPSGKAIRPGDVVRTMSGKTIEILNTDAEGRVTLADTLFYGAGLRPDLMVDLATLTGACMVALGEEVAGVMSNSDKDAAKLLAAAEDAGELMWRMPLVDEYRGMVKSAVADFKNISGSRYGGTITAGVFLENFVGGTPWVHVDMAGPAWAERDSVPHQPLGATGFGVRTLLTLIARL